MTLYDTLVARRTLERLQSAEAASTRVLATLRGQGIDIRVFGSLARGTFKSHSDVDFLVKGALSGRVRAVVEATLARAMGAAELPYDVIYLDDLTAEQAAVFDCA